jgi:hypothetical protein
MSSLPNSTSAISMSSAKEWDEVRSAFGSSIMVDTALSSLAQNLDGLDWPFTGADERPSTYLDYTYAELQAEFEGRANPAATDLLIQILRETISFDQPFGEMVKQTEAASQRENPMLRTLSRLQIPEHFPLGLTLIDDSTRELCQLEKVQTIGQFALFAQNVSQNVIVGGTFRELLNALAHVDEKVLGGYLPLRFGSPGLHFIEALRQATRSTNPSSHVAFAIAWFDEEVAQWRREAAVDPLFLHSQLAVMNDAALQQCVAELIAPHFITHAPRVGVWATFVSWFRR